MPESGANPKVDFFFRKGGHWQEEYSVLREIALGCRLTEELKWGVPCYTHEGSNIVLIHGFKEYCALLFFKGALLRDAKHILIQQTKNVQAARQARFTSVREIEKLSATLQAYIFEAIEVEKAGLKVPLKKTAEFTMPVEFKQKLRSVPGLKKAFNSLTPGRQRGYLLFFSSPKLPKTRQSRVEKYMKHILAGKGLED